MTPPLDDLETLEGMIINKYQPKHVSWDQLVNVCKPIADRKAKHTSAQLALSIRHGWVAGKVLFGRSA